VWPLCIVNLSVPVFQSWIMDVCSSKFDSKIVNNLCNAARSVDGAVVSILADLFCAR